MKNVQLFMNIYDILPHEPLWDRITDKHKPPEDWDKIDLINDIREHGFKYQLNIDPDGNIRNGNARYWVARMLLEEEGDERFRYLPVQRSFASGMHCHVFQANIQNELLKPLPGETKEETNKRCRKLAEEIIDKLTLNMFTEFMNTKDALIASKVIFEDYEIDPDNEVFLKRHWDQSSGEYTSFVIQHPKEKKYIFALMLEGHRSYEELLNDERLKDQIGDLRQNYKNGKKDWQNRQLVARIKRKEKS